MQATEGAVVLPTLDQITSNPNVLANMTEAQMDALMNQAPADAPAEGEKTGSESPAAASQEVKEAPAAAVVEQPKGVQTKDGGHIIPYSVLERERDRAARAEATAAALADQLKQLQAGGNAGAAGDAAVDLTEDDLAQLDQDLPGVAKNIRALMGKIENLTGTVQSLQQNQETEAQVEAQSAQDVLNAEIAANPDLLAWHNAKFADPKNSNPVMWDRVADQDAILREDPHWKNVPMADRFKKAAELAKALGPSAATASPDTPQQIKAKADAALAAAGGTATALPRSLGDIPGGAAAPSDELAVWLTKSGPQATADFSKMSSDQIERTLNRLT